MYEIIVDCTNRCFMHCRYCGTDSAICGSQYLDMSQVVKLISIAKRYDMRVFLGGGCFFCHPNWIEILKHNEIVSADVHIDVPLAKPVLKALHDYPPDKYRYAPSVSLWGIGETNDALSGVKSFYLLKDYQDIVSSNFRCSFVMTRYLLNQRTELVNFINQLKYCQQIYFHRLMPTGRCKKDDLPDIEELLRFKEFVLRSVNLSETIKFHHTLCNERCRAYHNRLFVDWSGNVFGCGWIGANSKSVGNINSIDILDLIKQSISGQYDGQIGCPICE